MIKIVLTGVWVCIVTLAAVYFSIHLAMAPASAPTETAVRDTQLVKGETVTIPMIDNGGVRGYFLGRVSLMADKAKASNPAVPLKDILRDELFTLLVGNKMVDLAHIADFKLDTFRSSIKDAMNKRLGDGTVTDVLVDQLDYMNKDDVKANAVSGGTKPPPVTKIVEGVKLDEVSPPSH